MPAGDQGHQRSLSGNRPGSARVSAPPLHGQAGYHGVAVFSRLPLEDAEAIAWCGKDDCRHLRLRLPRELELHNLYVPAGGRIPDPEINAKFAHKLEFLAALTEWFRADFDPERRAVLVGDLNIAPLPTDVWNHGALLKVVTHTPGEVAALAALQSAHGWIDARRVIPLAQRLFTWWSYWRPTGRRRTGAAASTMSRLRPRSWIACVGPRCCARRAAGRSPRPRARHDRPR